MNGMCYSTSLTNNLGFNQTPMRHHIPLTNCQNQITDNGIVYFSYGEVGFSLHLTANSSDLIIGAPGVYQWTGATVFLNDSSQMNHQDATIVDPKRGFRIEKSSDDSDDPIYLDYVLNYSYLGILILKFKDVFNFIKLMFLLIDRLRCNLRVPLWKKSTLPCCRSS